jgi:ribosomal protein S18 acetylase RimI-like enzyme
VHELLTADELTVACGDDVLCMWVAQGMTGPARAWLCGPAVLVTCPSLSGRDRAAVVGEPEAAARLVAEALPMAGPSFRLLSYDEMAAELTARLPWLATSRSFGWMNTTAAPGPPTSQGPPAGGEPGAPRWLEEGEMAAVTDLLSRSFPNSYAWPGMDGVRRWAGIDGPDGRLAAVAADAWSAPTVGFMAGVAVREDSRGQGLGGRICAFAAADLTARHGRTALMVDGWNDPAIRLYQRIGLTFRPVRAAWDSRHTRLAPRTRTRRGKIVKRTTKSLRKPVGTRV